MFIAEVQIVHKISKIHTQCLYKLTFDNFTQQINTYRTTQMFSTSSIEIKLN